MLQFSESEGTWKGLATSSVAATLELARSHSISVVLRESGKDYVYFIGGKDALGEENLSTFRYDPEQDSWRRCVDAPKFDIECTQAFVLDGKICLVESSQGANRFWEFVPEP